MPPRLSHKKTRTGCQRCKARKVKCDELRPSCSACSRHHVPCEYTSASTPTAQHALPTPPQDVAASIPSRTIAENKTVDATLELHLMHEWIVYASKDFTTAWEYWVHQIPHLCLQYRYVADATLALAALHASRRPRSLWVPTAGRMVPLSELTDPNRDVEELIPNAWGLDEARLESYRKAMLEKASRKEADSPVNSPMLISASHEYFNSAVEGHRKAIADFALDDMEALYATSVLVSFLALCNLGNNPDEPQDPVLWLQLGSATRRLCMEWMQMIGPGFMAFAGVSYGAPNMMDEAELFHIRHAKPFEHLLTLGRDFENMSSDDEEAYQQSLSYIGLIYKSVTEGIEAPEMTCRRLTAMPSRLPPRYMDLVVQRQPRALAIIAHMFACMKMLDGKSVWFLNVADVQVPNIQRLLPPAWKPAVDWPVAVVEGRSRSVSQER